MYYKLIPSNLKPSMPADGVLGKEQVSGNE